MLSVILAGGFGERLMPLTDKIPKPLVSVFGRPCIDYVIKSLVKANFNRIIITTAYMSDTLIKNIEENRYNAEILYSFEDKPLGTAGAVRKVRSFLNETFLVISGDVLAEVDIATLYEFHKKKNAKVTMALIRVKNPLEFGIVKLNKKNEIIKFKEKPKEDEIFSNLINAGIYVIEPEIIEFVPKDEKFDFSKQLFPLLMKKGIKIFGKEIKGLWMDIGSPADLLKANYEIGKKNKSAIAKTVKIGKKASIKGYCFIGENVIIGEYTKLKNCYILENVAIDKDCIIENSIIMKNSKIGWKTEIRSSIIAENCVIEEDVKLINSIIGEGVKIRIHSYLKSARLTS